MIAPIGARRSRALRWVAETYYALKSVLKQHVLSTGAGDLAGSEQTAPGAAGGHAGGAAAAQGAATQGGYGADVILHGTCVEDAGR